MKDLIACMKPKMIATLAAAFVAAVAVAYEVPFGGDFAEAGADGFPSAWTWHDYPAYLPRADVKVERGDGGNEIHYFNARGENGSAIRSKKRIPGKAGDVVTVCLESRGSGKAWFSLYCWTAQNEWSYGLVPHQVDLSDDWKETTYSFTLMGKWTGAFEVAVGIKPGADARFRNVRVIRRLETESELSMDDYEAKGDRPGNPKIVRGDIAPGLQSHTGKGVYSTTRRVDIVPAARHEMPGGGRFLTSGLRLYGFGANGAGRLGTAFAHGGERFVFAIAPVGGEIACCFTGSGRHVVPATTLPADFVFSAATDGTYDLAVTSLANSQTTRFSGRSDFFVRASNGVERTVALFASGGKKAEVTVDNVFLAVSRPERQAEIAYPHLAKPQAEFDPEKEGWPLVFSDEFEGPELDGGKWDLSHPDRSELPKVVNGILRVKTDHVPGSADKLEASSRLWSVPTFLYGYFEARLKFTTYNGWWAAFWLCSRGTGNPFLDGFEIDIFEDYYMRNPERNKLDHNLHIQGDGPLKSWNYNSTLPGTYRDWYTIGCKWTPFEITYYLNGKAIPSKASHSPYDTVTFDAFRHGTGIVPLHAIVSSQIMTTAYGKHDPDPGEVFPEYFDVDHVRVYGYPGAAVGAAPTVTIASEAERKFAVPKGPPISFKVSAKPAAKTGAKIKAVHLFDGGYYVATKKEPPYDFVIPMTEEFFSRTAWSLPGRSGGRPAFDGSYHVFCAFAEDENGEVGHSGTIPVTVGSGDKPRPFRGKAATIPGVIVAGHYDEGGQGVAYRDTTPGNVLSDGWRRDDGVDGREHSVGGVVAGEWVRYTVDIKKAGRYRLKFKYGTPSPFPHKVDVLIDGARVATLGPLPRHAADDWSADTVAEADMKLPSGRHVLTLHLLGQFNFTDFEFVDAKR